jgi:hypothetical protein
VVISADERLSGRRAAFFFCGVECREVGGDGRHSALRFSGDGSGVLCIEAGSGGPSEGWAGVVSRSEMVGRGGVEVMVVGPQIR